jgi:hypothetical protein
MQEVECAADEEEHGNAETDEEDKDPLFFRRQRRGGDAEIRKGGEVEILERKVIPGGRLIFCAGEDDSENGLQHEEEDAVKDTGEDPEKDAPDEADFERLHIAEKTLEDGAAVFREIVRGGGGDV